MKKIKLNADKLKEKKDIVFKFDGCRDNVGLVYHVKDNLNKSFGEITVDGNDDDVKNHRGLPRSCTRDPQVKNNLYNFADVRNSNGKIHVRLSFHDLKTVSFFFENLLTYKTSNNRLQNCVMNENLE